MKKYLLFWGLLLGVWVPALAQKVLLAQDVTKDTVKQTFGPNQKYFGHFYTGFGLVAGPSEAKGSAVQNLRSNEFLFGYRYKYKVASFYALGLDLALSFQSFNLKQQAGKTLPNTQLYDKEKLKFTNAGLGLYNRFNFDKRGNYIGKYLDLGVYGNWVPFKTHVYQDDHIFGLIGPLSGVKKVKVRETGLKYVADFNYGALARIGTNQFALYGAYRLSDLFDSGYAQFNENGINVFDFAELPRFMIGLQISLHE